jgi:hypothetical protein
VDLYLHSPKTLHGLRSDCFNIYCKMLKRYTTPLLLEQSCYQGDFCGGKAKVSLHITEVGIGSWPFFVQISDTGPLNRDQTEMN